MITKQDLLPSILQSIQSIQSIQSLQSLPSILILPLIGFVFYNDINWITGISGICLYIIYNFIYVFSTIKYFAMAIAPQNYNNPEYQAHKLVAYSFSTFHAIYISLFSTLYLYQFIDNHTIKQAFFISMSYYLADLYYVIDSTNKLTKQDYITICHHNIMIFYQMFVFIQNDYNLENNLLYYLNRGFIAEYSVISLNYSWYLLNTKQKNSKKMIISSIITIIMYYFTRVVNFTLLIYSLWNDGFLLIASVMMPLFFINYYWFYKLVHKATRFMFIIPRELEGLKPLST